MNTLSRTTYKYFLKILFQGPKTKTLFYFEVASVFRRKSSFNSIKKCFLLQNYFQRSSVFRGKLEDIFFIGDNKKLPWL